MLINRTNLNMITTGINTAMVDALKSQAALSDYNLLCYRPPKSTKKTEQYGWLANLPDYRPWIGDRHIGNVSKYGMQVTTAEFEATIELNEREIEDDDYLRAFEASKALAYKWPKKLNTMTYRLLEQGMTTLAFDQAMFFSNSHPVTNATGGTTLISNLQAGVSTSPWYLMDLSDPVARPLILRAEEAPNMRQLTSEESYARFMRRALFWGNDGDIGVGLAFWQKALRSNAVLDAANFTAARLQMSSVILEGGEKAGFRPTHLVCGETNRAAAENLLTLAQVAVQVGTSAATQSNANFNAVKLIVSPWLP